LLHCGYTEDPKLCTGAIYTNRLDFFLREVNCLAGQLFTRL